MGGTSVLQLHPPIATAQTLAPNDKVSTRWQCWCQGYIWASFLYSRRTWKCVDLLVYCHWSYPSVSCHDTPLFIRISGRAEVLFLLNSSIIFQIIYYFIILYFMSLWCQWVKWGYGACELRVCYYDLGGELQTHILQTWGANFGNTSNSRVAVKKKRNIFISICTYPVSLLTLLVLPCLHNIYLQQHW